jgi:hypothetical protein
MHSVGAELYQTRVERLASAISTIEQQTEIDRQLILGYDRLVTMIDIELESNAVATSLPDPVSQSLSAKLAS